MPSERLLEKHYMNQIIFWLKAPAALLMVMLLPVGALALGRLVQVAAALPQQWLPLFAGLLAFLAFWLIYLRRRAAGSWLYALEHEATHALFALLTFNRVTNLHAGQGNGSVSYQGTGNWLISLAPYFFPTFCVPVLLMLQVAVVPARPWLLGVLGFCLAMQLHSTWVETHLQQTDLLRHGRWASVCILPGAVVLGLLAVLWATPEYRPAVQRAWRDAWSNVVFLMDRVQQVAIGPTCPAVT